MTNYTITDNTTVGEIKEILREIKQIENSEIAALRIHADGKSNFDKLMEWTEDTDSKMHNLELTMPDFNKLKQLLLAFKAEAENKNK